MVESQFETVVRVGEYLIEHFYGSVQEASARRPRKDASLRSLMERAGEFGMTATGVRTSVAIALQSRELGRGLAQRLGIAQHRALLPLRDSGEKRVLAVAAVDANWSAERLRTRLRKLQKKHKGGRPREPPIALLVARVERALDRELLARRRELSDGVDHATAKALLGRVQTAQRHLETMERELVRVVARAGDSGG